jgi:hypothetical protein
MLHIEAGSPHDAQQVAHVTDTQMQRRPNGHRKARLLSRDALDGRTTAAKQFEAIASGIAADLGGEDRLSTVQKHLVEAFAGCAVVLSDINTRAMTGVEQIDLLAYSTAVSTLVRVANKLGIRRLPRDITPPGVADYLQHKEREKAARPA